MLNWHDWLHIAIGAIEALSLISKFSLKLKLKLKLKSQLKKDKKKAQEYDEFLAWKKAMENRKNNEK